MHAHQNGIMREVQGIGRVIEWDAFRREAGPIAAVIIVDYGHGQEGADEAGEYNGSGGK